MQTQALIFEMFGGKVPLRPGNTKASERPYLVARVGGEQNGLQQMWDDPVLNSAAKGMELLHLMNTTINTPIGQIVAPPGANDVTNLQDRIAIATNAFNYIYRNLYMGSNASWKAVNSTLMMRMNPATLPQRPTPLLSPIFGFGI
jgi:hypothetical protein